MLVYPPCTCKPAACSLRVMSRFGLPSQRTNNVARLDRGCGLGVLKEVRAVKHGRLQASSSEGEPVMMPNNLQETAMLDKLVDLLLDCKSQEELVRAVGENILALDQKFWLRLATRVDTADNEAEKEALTSLSRAVMSLVDTMVKKADSQLTDSSKILGEILKTAADETGNWSLPLGQKEVVALNKALDDYKDDVNEALLANAFAWMRKSSEDKLDGMVVLLQRLLQIYAARELKSEEKEGPDGFLNELLEFEPDEWEDIIVAKGKAGEVDEMGMTKAVQMKLEGTILLPSGSNAQRVQVEFLSEMKTRVKSAFEKLEAPE